MARLSILLLTVLAAGAISAPLLAAPLKKGVRALVAFEHSPFPFEGKIPGKDEPFFDVVENGRKGHTSPRGGIYWQDETYSDRRVLLNIPRGFDAARPGVIVVFFHGNKSILERDVVRRQQVPQQVARAGLNAVLVAPQLAVDALDSTAGRFYLPGFFAKFMDEAARELARLAGDARLRATFEALPVVIVAYSGGYTPAAWAAHHGGLGDRLKAVLLFDALYGDLDKFAAWVERRAPTVFFSAHSKSAREPNTALQARLAGLGLDVKSDLPAAFAPGQVVFYAASEEVLHGDFLTKAWMDDPVEGVLRKLGPVLRPPTKTAAKAKAKPKPRKAE
ncbi:MAG: alpha/beta hydrolase [Hyphomicrobiaceae bacterium]|nr:alpha/beta hydrolase [Hyphomicrobiaceae bacterium]